MVEWLHDQLVRVEDEYALEVWCEAMHLEGYELEKAVLIVASLWNRERRGRLHVDGNVASSVGVDKRIGHSRCHENVNCDGRVEYISQPMNIHQTRASVVILGSVEDIGKKIPVQDCPLRRIILLVRQGVLS